MDELTQSAWLRLANTPKLSSKHKRTLIEHYGCASVLYATPYRQIQHQLGTDSTFVKHLSFQLDDAKLQHQLGLLVKHNINILPCNHAHYPSLLAQLSDAPPLLFTQGDVSLLNGPQIAIVGSRNATPAGLKTASQFAKQLAQSGISVTSGLAQGIDGAAHQGAVDEIGKTIAVVATGLDQIYPRNHVNLAQQVRENGAIVSEFVPGTAPRREFFPRRNRIISGLSLGVLVVEAGVRSGSLITARLAGEQGREIYAIPGSIHVPTSRGCHQLIRQGAKLVETTKDILEELKASTDLFSMLPSKTEPKRTNTAIELDWDFQQVLNLVDFEPTGLDELARRSKFSIDSLSAILLELELKGLIATASGGRYQRLPA